MTKKDLLHIIIKLFGLYSAISFFDLYFSQIGYLTSFMSYGNDSLPLSVIAWLVILLVLMVALVSILIFYPDLIIKIFRLDRGFDDNEVSIKTINLENLICFAIILTGGFLIANSISPVVIGIGDIITQITKQRGVANIEYRNNFYANILNLIIGYLLVTNFKSVTKFIFSLNKEGKDIQS